MTAQFSGCIDVLKLAEGGESSRVEDYGGLTKYGISSREYPHIDIANLTFDGACDIYIRDYWNRYQLSEIDDQTIANQCFLLLINMNPREAITIVQRAAIVAGRTMIVLTVDGVLGKQTFSAINSVLRFDVSDNIRIEAVRYYLAETDRDIKQIPNLRSWIRRALL
jgi:lysozyme family protein